MKTKVIFKMFENEVIALFPEEIADYKGNISSYMHIGQHSAASPALVDELEDATPEQYKELYNELTNSVGYKLEIINGAQK